MRVAELAMQVHILPAPFIYLFIFQHLLLINTIRRTRKGSNGEAQIAHTAA
jgi:thiosulfate reductase cytochrome b subunit